MAGELAAEWIRIPDGNGNLRKVWIRDSQARRDIAQLQTDVSGKADAATTLAGYGITDAYTKTQIDGMIPSVPSASTSNPLMDGTASPGSSTSWARGDHVHPHDSTKADVSAIPAKTSDLTNDSDFQTGAQVSNAIDAEAGLMIPYGYCTTAAATAAKTVTVSPTITSLETGLTVAVKFQYANTGSNPTLNVNSLGAVAIKRYGTTAAGTSAAANWNANAVVMLIYDGTYWMLVDWNNTTYSGMTDAEYQAGTGTSNRLITPARLKAAIELHAPVQSVNGQTGAVTVNVPTKTSDLTNDSGFITSAPVTSVNGQTGAVTISVPTKTSDLTNDSGFLTSAPVASVNGQTGTVSLDASDVGALPDSTTIPNKTSQLTNDSGFLTSAPVTSVNTKTGAVSLTASDVGALPDNTAIPTKTSDLTNDSGFITASAVPGPSSAAPAMDGTAAAGSSAAYSRADHVHPHDTSKQDSLSAGQLSAVNSGVTAAKVAEWDAIEVPTKTSELTNDSDFITGSKFAYISGTLPAGSGSRSSYTAFPSGFNENNTILFGLSVLVNGEWRYGEGISTTNGRTFLIMNSSGVASYNTASNLFSATWKCGLMRTDI